MSFPETLLEQLPQLSDETLTVEYLNQLQWTEAIANLLTLVDSKVQALRMVELALEVDLTLGAKLLGKVKPKFQTQAIELLMRIEMTDPLKIFLLGRTKTNRAIPHLEQFLMNASSSRLRENALESLANLGSSSALVPLLRAMKDKVPAIRRMTAEVLGNIGHEVAVNSLVFALEDPDRTVPIKAAEALGKIATPTAIDALEKSFQNRDDSERWWSVAIALGKLDDRAAMATILSALGDRSTSTRIAAADALGEIGNRMAISALIEALGDKHEFVRTRAAYALATIGSDVAVQELIQALAHKTRRLVRESAAIALAEIGTPAAEAALMSALEDKYEVVRMRAHQGLVKIRAANNCNPDTESSGSDNENAPTLEEWLDRLSDRSSFVREEAAKQLGKIGNDIAVYPLLESAVTDDTYSVRKTAIEALESIGTPAALNALMSALNGGSGMVRQQVSEALVNIGTGKLLPQLWKDVLTTGDLYLLDAIAAIQKRCRYYNYELAK